MIVRRPVGEVNARDIHPRRNEFGDHGFRIGDWTDCANDLGAADQRVSRVCLDSSRAAAASISRPCFLNAEDSSTYASEAEGSNSSAAPNSTMAISSRFSSMWVRADSMAAKVLNGLRSRT